MRSGIQEMVQILQKEKPEAYALVYGTGEFTEVYGIVSFYSIWMGTLVVAYIAGFPIEEEACKGRIWSFHIHEGSECTGNETDPFANTKFHYNPDDCLHPEHAGDLPPLFSNHGIAIQIFYTDRFQPEEVIGRTVVIHDMPDDFRTQPSGDSGSKIACGKIVKQ